MSEDFSESESIQSTSINDTDNSSLNKSNSNINNDDENDDNDKVPAEDDENDEGNSMFDCNICLDSPTDPIVTQCGHLFCWPCIYQWIERSTLCPVCKAGITKENVIPIYGRGQEKKDPRFVC